MKVSEVMTKTVVRVDPEESVDVAARLLTHYNIGALPVCTDNGKLLGVVTDRDLVIRCMAAKKPAENTKVRQIMTRCVVTVEPSSHVLAAAKLMGEGQVRRLPVVEKGTVCGMISVSDLMRSKEMSEEMVGSLSAITANIRGNSGI